MNKLIIDIANEKIFLMIITKDDIYNITKENTKINYEKLTLILKDFLNSNNLKLEDIQKIYGLDPSEELCEMAKKTARDYEVEINFLINGAEEIKLPSQSVDTVLITYTLCSIAT